jgi:serine/threonine-protein kinase HipA
MSQKKEIYVYAHWEKINDPFLMGTLTSVKTRGKEVFAFEYDQAWLESELNAQVDPDLLLYPGQFYTTNEKPNFGVFMDSSPDRWGRVLMNRKEAILARQEKRQEKQLLESDYLLGVYDGHRMGGLRFKLDESESFLNNDLKMAAPPWASLRELEQASINFEQNEENDDEALHWINLLLAPGSSLGGARPKASIVDTNGHLWIAKFPSIKDKKDIGAWEMVANKLAVKAGINIAEGDIRQFNNEYHTYLTKRFDRNTNGERIHFASAMTLLGYTDGAGEARGVSYVELAEFIIKNGCQIDKDLEELWRRIVFHICIKNTDDHLRNHGFLLTNQGWKLSPAYDINPNEFGTGLSLNISENDNSLDLELAFSVAKYFRISESKSKEITQQVQDAVLGWNVIASDLGISKAEQRMMSKSFS